MMFSNKFSSIIAFFFAFGIVTSFFACDDDDMGGVPIEEINNKENAELNEKIAELFSGNTYKYKRTSTDDYNDVLNGALFYFSNVLKTTYNRGGKNVYSYYCATNIGDYKKGFFEWYIEDDRIHIDLGSDYYFSSNIGGLAFKNARYYRKGFFEQAETTVLDGNNVIYSLFLDNGGTTSYTKIEWERVGKGNLTGCKIEGDNGINNGSNTGGNTGGSTGDNSSSDSFYCTNFTFNSAQTSATVNFDFNERVSTASVKYGRSSASSSVSSSISAKRVTARITGLTKGTTYKVKCTAKGTNGLSYTADYSFYTIP